jgi:hypothetical protein
MRGKLQRPLNQALPKGRVKKNQVEARTTGSLKLGEPIGLYHSNLV